MPRKRSKKRYTVKADRVVYCILSPFGRAVYAGSAKRSALRSHYKDHYTLRKEQTKELFAAAKAQNIVPKMYRLEELSDASDAESYSHCVAWTRYFTEHDFCSLAHEKTNEYAADLLGTAAEVYEEIRDLPLKGIFCTERDLFPNYGKKQRRSEKQPDKITFRVSEREYRGIQFRAEVNGKSVSEYCRTLALDGCTIYLDQPRLHQALNELIEANALVRQSVASINASHRCTAEDLQRLQNLADIVSSQSADVEAEISSMLRRLEKITHISKKKGD